MYWQDHGFRRFAWLAPTRTCTTVEEVENELVLQASDLGFLYVLTGVQNASEEGSLLITYHSVLLMTIVVFFATFARFWPPSGAI